MTKSFKDQFRLFLRFTRYILPYRKTWLMILILSGLGALLSLVNPYLTKVIVDRAIGNKDLRSFVILALIGASVFILSSIIHARKVFLGRYIKLRVNFSLNKKLFKLMRDFPLGWFQDRSTGEHLYKFDHDLESTVHFITTTPSQAIYLFLRLLLTIVIVFYLNWRMAILSLCLAPFLLLPPYYFSRIMRKVWEDFIKKSETIFKYLQEFFTHIQIVKAFGKQVAGTRQYLRKLVAKMKIEVKLIKLEIFSNIVSNATSKIAIGVIFFFGGYQVIRGSLTLGSLTAIMVYLTQLIGLQRQFASFFQTTALGLVSCQRVANILDEKTRIVESEDAKKILFKNTNIEFRDVSFWYREGEYVLKDLSFCVGNGGHIAFTGHSGCGKTTLLYLLVRLYDSLSGAVLIDGHDIRDLTLSSLREQVGFSFQEPFLWNDSVESNIKYTKEDATREEVVRMAKLSGVDEFVKGLPQGYETIIGENACKLSEGQKQKIAIARTLIKEPKILILDEAMSSMDSEAEEKILSNIKDNFKDLTLITVSHRLSTAMNADSVYFFSKDGAIITGDMQNLLKNNKEFSDLFSGQNKILT